MFLKKCKLKLSEIDGIGLFAEEDIKKGEIIYKSTQINRILVNKNIVEKEFPKDLSLFFKRYSYLVKQEYVMDYDETRFTNHSDDPNTTDSNIDLTIAIKDIKKGEEITTDYRIFDESWEEKLSMESSIKISKISHYITGIGNLNVKRTTFRENSVFIINELEEIEDKEANALAKSDIYNLITCFAKNNPLVLLKNKSFKILSSFNNLIEIEKDLNIEDIIINHLIK